MISNRLPRVSVLIAARNEENNIRNCIEALALQQYPAGYFDVWVGDDQSDDDTAGIVKELQQSTPNLHLLEVRESVNGLLGKANVLAQLACRAQGEIFLITDADVLVKDSWITGIIEEFSDTVDMVSGVVALKGDGLFAQLQNADWITYSAWCYRSCKKGKPVTALGGNMAIRSSAYRKIGGYEKIPFSVTEDYEMFRAFIDSGHGFKALFQPEILAFTHPAESFGALLKQRRRWLTSSFRRNWFSNVEFNTNSLHLPFLIGLAVISPVVSVAVFFIKWLVEFTLLRSDFKRLSLQVNTGAFLHSPYAMICNFIFLFFIFFHVPIEWKGRTYT